MSISNNALKNISPDGIARVPSAYKIEEITITNAKGVAIDIQNITKEVLITESIYSPTIICEISVLDESNILETLPMYGLETIHVKIVQIANSKEQQGEEFEIDRVFYVTEYPVYGRARREHSQVWTARGVSYHAWKNPTLKISRGYVGPIAAEINKIGEESFGLVTNLHGEPISEGRGIINIQTPLQAIEWFRRRLFEEDGCCFYYYETIQNDPNEVILASHSAITSRGIHERYYDTRDYNVNVATPEDYHARKQRVLESASMLKLSKAIPSRAGTFAAESIFVDLANRSFFKRYYEYKRDFPTGKMLYTKNILDAPSDFKFPDNPKQIEPTSLEPDPKPNDEDLNALPFAHMNYTSLNSEAFFDSTLQNYNVWSHTHSDILNAFPGVFDTLVHDITIHGDFELNPGKVVELMLPKAADPAHTGTDDLWDNHLSGKYIVVSAIHRFKNQEYTTSFRAKRDSFTL